MYKCTYSLHVVICKHHLRCAKHISLMFYEYTNKYNYELTSLKNSG